ncbi:MAG TPA: universal stress protein [Burkholderiales bacterium]|nr:universal stress protein [Burkholderiales bacterium]
MFKHILLPTDGSKLSNDAAEAGVRLARALGARVTALFAAPPATPIIYKAMLPVGYATPDAHKKMTQRAAAACLATVEKAARAAGVPFESVTVTSDFPADTIVATAKKHRCDLVFMASHGRRGLKGALLGSQTQKVLADGSVPVLVYRKGR